MCGTFISRVLAVPQGMGAGLMTHGNIWGRDAATCAPASGRSTAAVSLPVPVEPTHLASRQLAILRFRVPDAGVTFAFGDLYT